MKEKIPPRKGSIKCALEKLASDRSPPRGQGAPAGAAPGPPALCLQRWKIQPHLPFFQVL